MLAEVVDYHSTETVKDFAALQIRSYISEPKRGRRKCNTRGEMPPMPTADGYGESEAASY